MNTALRAKCQVIALTNQKGGVAKSFTTASLAVGLVREGKKVLVIDNDPQGHASRCLGIKKAEITIADVMGRLIKGEQLYAGY
ncbi:MAG: AAA family ATPase, partial [Lachnospiraceae bacterium]|nr:AAA family ATPase [Candidatus Merdinaster equi]